MNAIATRNIAKITLLTLIFRIFPSPFKFQLTICCPNLNDAPVLAKQTVQPFCRLVHGANVSILLSLLTAHNIYRWNILAGFVLIPAYS
jgi:hypothetical protein